MTIDARQIQFAKMHIRKTTPNEESTLNKKKYLGTSINFFIADLPYSETRQLCANMARDLKIKLKVIKIIRQIKSNWRCRFQEYRDLVERP
jgi:hypothetical protein